MSSPFSTLEAFNSAADGPTEGAIYTFANAPLINNIALLASVGLFFWFMISTYTTHAKPPAINKSLDHLSSFIVIGLLSLVMANYKQPASTVQTAQNEAQTLAEQPYRKSAPLGLLGMVSMGLPTLRRSRAKQKRYSRRFSRDSWR